MLEVLLAFFFSTQIWGYTVLTKLTVCGDEWKTNEIAEDASRYQGLFPPSILEKALGTSLSNLNSNIVTITTTPSTFTSFVRLGYRHFTNVLMLLIFVWCWTHVAWTSHSKGLDTIFLMLRSNCLLGYIHILLYLATPTWVRTYRYQRKRERERERTLQWYCKSNRIG